MKNLWSCRRTFLSFVAMIGLLHLMGLHQKDYSLEVVLLALGVGALNVWQTIKGKANDSKP